MYDLPHRWILALCLALVLLPRGAGAEIDGPNGAQYTADEIRQWVRDLDSDLFIQRELATERLVQTGAEAIEPVVEALAANNLEVTTRGVHILQELALDPDTTTSEAARVALEAVAQPRATSAARRALEALARLDLIRHQRALDDLKRLGAQVGNRQSALRFQLVDDFTIEIGENWRGQPADLASLRFLHGLDELILNHPEIDDQVLRSIGKMGSLARLRMRHANISDDGLTYLSELQGLQTLSILYSPVGDSAVPTLGSFQSLVHVQLYGTRLTRAGHDQLARALPGAELDIRPGGAFLGVGCDPAQPGCVVYTVRPNTAAERAGLMVNDRILEYEGTSVEDFQQLTALIAEHKPGETVSLKIVRGGEQRIKKVTLGDWERLD